MKKLFRRREFLTRRTRYMIEAFVTAWIIRSWLDRDWGGDGTWLWWLNVSLSSTISLTMFVLLFTKAKAEPTAPADREVVDRYLKRNHFMLITREQAGQLIPGMLATPHVAPNTTVFADPAALQKLIDTWPKSVPARLVDKRHLPGCRKRTNPEATCICGERGFSGSNPMPPKMADEWRRLHEDGT